MSALTEADIDTGMIDSVFEETPGHSTLGAEFQVGQEGLAGLDVGTKIFVLNSDPALHNDVAYDSVGVIVGHQEDKVQVLTLSAKGGPWGSHNAYGGLQHEIPDALAALDRLFDPQREFGSIAVLSQATRFGAATAESTIGDAGCDSHEKTQLQNTLSYSQLLDQYHVGAVMLGANSGLIRRDTAGLPVALAPGQTHPGQPTREQRDKRSMLDRIEKLTTDQASPVLGYTPSSVLRGISAVTESGAFADRERPIASVQQSILREANRLVL